MTAALRDNDFALSDHQLQRFLEIVVEDAADGDLAEATAEFRQALGAEATHERLVSPWVSNVAILDNRAAGFSAVNPEWGAREMGAHVAAIMTD
jgi:hypothetical protein